MRRIHDTATTRRDEQVHRARRIAAAAEQGYVEARQTAIATHGFAR
ncbi:hypothetical protein [Agrococcus sp. SGAir0287]|nr:hypothetical protein [Agrococcus sp. SGAir0287]